MYKQFAHFAVQASVNTLNTKVVYNFYDTSKPASTLAT